MTTQQKKTTAPASAAAPAQGGQSVRDRLRERQRPTSTLTICDDHDIKQELARARYMRDRTRAQFDEDPTEAGAAKALDDAEVAVTKAQAAFDEQAIVMRFQALERLEYEELKKAHPPTEEQSEDGAEWNIDTFGPALIAASSLDHLTVEDANHFLNTWAPNEAVQLYEAAMSVQRESRMDLGKG